MPIFTPQFHRTKLYCDACGETGVKLDRHHIGREYLFVSILAKAKLGRTKWYKKFRKRYYEFRPYDIRYLCRDCHKEIHEEYNEALRTYNFLNYYKPIEQYTIEEVRDAIKFFRKTYFEWRGSR